MAKTTAPALSFDAAGTLAKTMTFTRWRGIPVVRRYAVPSNPNTTPQAETRDIFRTMNQMWKLAPEDLRAPWNAFASGRPFLGSNQFIGQNLTLFRKPTTQTDMELFKGSPGARGGLPPGGLVLTPAATSIEAAITAPELPTGWTITRAVAVAFVDQDPGAAFTQAILAEEDDSDPYAPTFTGLPNTTKYIVSAWFEFEKSDGLAAYGVSLTATATTTS